LHAAKPLATTVTTVTSYLVGMFRRYYGVTGKETAAGLNMTSAGTATGAGMPTASGTDARTFVLHENVYFAQVPRLSVAHLAINPAAVGIPAPVAVPAVVMFKPALRAGHLPLLSGAGAAIRLHREISAS